MTTTLGAVRAKLRADLDDVAASDYRWEDDELDRHIFHALNEVSDAIPLEVSNLLLLLEGQRQFSVLDLRPRIRICRCEYPIDQYPPVFTRFALWGSTLTLHIDSAAPADSDVRVYWHAPHRLDEVDSTLDGPIVDVLLDGATAYAASQLASYTTERVSTGGPSADREYGRYANRKMRDFRHGLKTHGPKAGLRTGQLYTPAEPAPTQDTDPGP